MSMRILFWLSLALGLGAWGEPLRCKQIYAKTPVEVIVEDIQGRRDPSSIINPGALKKQVIEVDYNNTRSLQILDSILNIFYQYPAQWVSKTRGYTELNIPQSRWNDLFKQDFTASMMELLQTQIYRVDFYENGLREVSPQASLLISYRVIETEAGETVFRFRIDPRVRRMYDYVEEPSIARRTLGAGILRTETFPRRRY